MFYKKLTICVFLLFFVILVLPSDVTAANSSIFTISVWVKPETSIATKTIAAKAEEVRLVTDASGNPLCQIKSGTWQAAATSSAAISLNSWSYVTCSYDKTTLKIFVNGSQTGSTALTVALDDTAAALKFGTDDSADAVYGEFSGILDDVKFYNYARTTSQIAEDYAGGAGRKQPVGHWKFDEGYGITANNSGTQGSTLQGTLTNMDSPATYGSGWTDSGKFGKALNFDGSNDIVTNTNHSVSSIQYFSVCLWEKFTTDFTGHNGPFWISDSSGRMLFVENRVAFNYLGIATETQANNRIATSSQSQLKNGNWHQVCATRNDTIISLYIDGNSTALTQNNAYGSWGIGNNDYSIGGYMDSGSPYSYWAGSIDSVKIYNFALTEDEVKKEYNQNKAIVMGAVSTSSDGKTASNSASRAYCIPGDTSTCNPPVARWNFDEKTGTSANDISGNANTGTLGGGVEANRPSWISGKVGGGLRFDGSNDYVDASNGASLNITNAITVEAWVNTAAFGTNQYKGIVGRRTGALTDGCGFQYGLSSTWGSGNEIEFWAHKEGSTDCLSQNFILSSVIALNTYYHVVGTYDSVTGNQRLYLNGILNVQDNKGAGTLIRSFTNQPLEMGRNPQGGWFFNGSIDEVRIYNYARTPAQIAWDYNRGKPVAEWKFDECQGSIANDASGNGNTGTITIGATGTQTGLGTCTAVNTANAWYNGRNGKINSAMSFDGVDDYVVLSGAMIDNIGVSGDFTVSGWNSQSSFSGLKAIIVQAYGSYGAGHTYGRWMLGTSSNHGFVSLYGGGSSPSYKLITGSVNLASSQWNNILAVFSRTDSKIYLYVNGIYDSFVSWDGYIEGVQSDRNNIGYNFGTASYYMNGLIDSVKIYNYALTAEQIKTEYNGGAVRFGPETGSP